MLYPFNSLCWVMGQGGRGWQQTYGVQEEISEVWGYWPRSSFLHWLAHLGCLLQLTLLEGTEIRQLMHHRVRANAVKQEVFIKMYLEGTVLCSCARTHELYNIITLLNAYIFPTFYSSFSCYLKWKPSQTHIHLNTYQRYSPLPRFSFCHLLLW